MCGQSTSYRTDLEGKVREESPGDLNVVLVLSPTNPVTSDNSLILSLDFSCFLFTRRGSAVSLNWEIHNFTPKSPRISWAHLHCHRTEEEKQAICFRLFFLLDILAFLDVILFEERSKKMFLNQTNVWKIPRLNVFLSLWFSLVSIYSRKRSGSRYPAFPSSEGITMTVTLEYFPSSSRNSFNSGYSGSELRNRKLRYHGLPQSDTVHSWLLRQLVVV